MAAALDKMGADQNRIVPIFITIDPARDTPAVLKKYLAAFGPRFVGLTGTPGQIAQVEKEYRVYAKKQPLRRRQLWHGSFQRDLSDGSGRQARLVSMTKRASPDDLAKDLREKTLERG